MHKYASICNKIIKHKNSKWNTKKIKMEEDNKKLEDHEQNSKRKTTKKIKMEDHKKCLKRKTTKNN